MWQVYLKELTELLRDKKTLIFVILLPVLIFPVLFGVMGLVMSNVSRQAEAEEHRYVLINADKAAEFSDALFYHKNFKKMTTDLTEPAALKQAIRDGKFDVAIVIPADFDPAASNIQQSKWLLIHNSSSQLDMISKHFNELLKTYSTKLQQAKLVALGVSVDNIPAVLEPVAVEKLNTAESRENIGELIGGWIAYLLIPLCLAGASYPAMDIGAGEKERGTLETLLICPVARTAIVLGKFLTVLTTGLLTAAITVVSFGSWGYLIGSLAGVDVVAKTMSTLGLLDLTLILALLIPLTATLAAVLLSLSIYARSYKEAQNYLGPLTIIVLMPLVISILPGIELSWKLALVPVLNVALGIKELVKGTIDYSLLGLILLSTVALAGVMITFCISWFQREKVLFR